MEKSKWWWLDGASGSVELLHDVQTEALIHSKVLKRDRLFPSLL